MKTIMNWINKKKLTQMRFEIKNTEMKIISIKKKQFLEIIDKRYSLPDGILSLPYGHPSLNKWLSRWQWQYRNWLCK